MEIYAPIAASNNLVMYLPQAKYCWDVFGETGPNFLTRDGYQMNFLREMTLNAQKKADLRDFEE